MYQRGQMRFCWGIPAMTQCPSTEADLFSRCASGQWNQFPKPQKQEGEPGILSCLSAPWHSWELLQCSTLCTIFSCFQGDVLCDIDNCINPWFTQSAGKETAPFPTVGFLIAQWSVIYRHLQWSPLCAGRKSSAPGMVFVALLSSVVFLPLPALLQECLQCQGVAGMARGHPGFSVSQAGSLSLASPCARMFMVENTALITRAVLTAQRTCFWGFTYSP